MLFDPDTKILIAQLGIGVLLNIEPILRVDPGREVFNQRDHVRILHLICQVVAVDFKVGALIVSVE